MDVSPVHVATLREVAARGSFSRAADALGLTQPAISHHIRRLEEVLGVRVLERAGKRAFPTPAGDLLLAHAARAFAELEAARQAIRGARGRVAGRVRLGTGATASIHVLPPVWRRIRSRYPEVELIVVTGNSVDITARVVASDLDVAVVTDPRPSRSLAHALFFTDEQVAIFPPERAPRGRRPITPRELAGYPLILYEPGGTSRRIIDAWFQRAGVRPRVAMELGNSEAIKKLVESGLGVSVGSAISVRTEARAGSLRALRLDPPLARRLVMVRRRDKVPTPALAAVLEALEHCARRHLRPGGGP